MFSEFLFPLTRPLAGTFSTINTTAPGVVPFADAKDFKQFIQGGFTFNVFSSVGGSIINYEAVHKHFPKGVEGYFDRVLSPAVPMYGISWWARILPFLEQADIADQLDRTGANIGYVQLNSHNGALINGCTLISGIALQALWKSSLLPVGTRSLPPRTQVFRVQRMRMVFPSTG